MAVHIKFLVQKFIVAVNVKWRFDLKNIASNIEKNTILVTMQHINKEK